LQLVILPREKETLRLRSAELAILGVLIAFSLFLPFILSARAEEPLAEPSLVTVLNTLGYTNIALSSVQTFPAGTYETKLLAEFAGYHATNNFSYYPVGTSNFMLIFSGPEGNEGYVTPPITKALSCNTTLGFSMYVESESHRYFTETSLNPDGLQHAEIYANLDDPDMYFIGFENVYGWEGDRDFQDMVVSIELIQHYLTVQTQPFGITTIPGKGWYSNGTDVGLTAPDTVLISTGVRYNFSYWDINGVSQGAGVNPITVHMDANHTATAHYTLQYYLTVTSPHGTTGGEDWYDSDATAYASVSPLIVSGPAGTQYVFTHWSGDASGLTSPSDPITMDGPKTAVANWKTQHYLTITHTSGGVTDPASSGWYDAGENALVTAIPDTCFKLIRWELDGDDVGSDNPISIPINSPYTLHAVFSYVCGGSTAVVELHLTPTWISINSVLAAAFCVAAFYTKKRRERV
jgi:uncharacterized repeat protein (TIGR02543 family)